nr:transposase [Micromonospora echinaurantiaca]
MKVGDGTVANRPIYLALAVTVEGTRDIVGLWAGEVGEGAKFWLQRVRAAPGLRRRDPHRRLLHQRHRVRQRPHRPRRTRRSRSPTVTSVGGPAPSGLGDWPG